MNSSVDGESRSAHQDGATPAEAGATATGGGAADSEQQAAPARAPRRSTAGRRRASSAVTSPATAEQESGGTAPGSGHETGSSGAAPQTADQAALDIEVGQAPAKKPATRRRRATKSAAEPAVSDVVSSADGPAQDGDAAASEQAGSDQDAPSQAAPKARRSTTRRSATARGTTARAARAATDSQDVRQDEAPTASQAEPGVAEAGAADSDATEATQGSAETVVTKTRRTAQGASKSGTRRRPAKAAKTTVASSSAGEVQEDAAHEDSGREEPGRENSGPQENSGSQENSGPQESGRDEPGQGDSGQGDSGQDGDESGPATGRRRAGARGGSGRSRRNEPAERSPEQQIDVLAAFSAVETPQAPTGIEIEAEEDDEGEESDGLRLPATALLFQAPDHTRARPSRAKRKAAEDETAEEPDEPEVESPEAESRGAQDEPVHEPAHEHESAPSDSADADADAVQEPDADSGDADSDDDSEDEDGQGGARRRRRRGGRGRRKSGPKGQQDDSEDDSTAASAGEDGEDDSDASGPGDDTPEEDSGSNRRRRRRRRGRDSGDSDSLSDEITALKGSTRLEAKRQRRRDGRDASRRRTSITEAEFLARREAVDRDMIVRETDGRTQIAVLEDGVLVEHYVAKRSQTSMVGNVYLGRVQNVLPSMEAAFVDLGKGRNAVLYAGEVNWDAAGLEGGQPRRIEQALSSGDAVLVQVTKDPIGHKGARLTAQITLAGRYLVYVPSGAMTGISRKLPENERNRLKKLLKEIVPDGAGVIVRTAAEGATEEQLRADVERLSAQWAQIQKKQASAKSPPQLLRGEPELSVRVVRDVFNEDFRSLHVQGDEAWATIAEYVSSLAPDLVDRMHQWTSTKDIFAEHRIDEQLTKGMDRKVWLPSGGSLVIDRTEAMTVVDVNTGKFTGSGGTLEETVTKNNLEAAEEIVRQLRLRDIGGIIVIDFIDMVLESNRDLVLRRLVECLGRDRTRHQVAEVTSLGLVQMTRKRVGQGLVEAFSEQCSHCNGRGFIVHTHPVESGGDSEGSGSGRRRGRRGGNGGGDSGTAKASGGSGPKSPADDPSARAAREAVKATLATIAQAAANAHQGEEAETPAKVPVPGSQETEDPRDDSAPVAADSSSAPDVPGEASPEPESPESGSSGRASSEPGSAEPRPSEPDSDADSTSAAASQDSASSQESSQGAADQPKAPRKRRSGAAGGSRRSRSASAPATAPPSADPQPARPQGGEAQGSEAQGAAQQDQGGRESGGDASEANAAPQVIRADTGSGTSDVVGGASRPRGRRPRRAATSGPVTT